MTPLIAQLNVAPLELGGWMLSAGAALWIFNQARWAIGGAQKRDVKMVGDVVTEGDCDKKHKEQQEKFETLIKLRTMEQIAAYESDAKKSRRVLHDEISFLKTEVASVRTEIGGLKNWMKSTSETLQDVSNGLSNLAGAQGKG
ncbi:MAG: hypothetical protein NTY01_05530 [Verrucomicrobia bacterium]|nr:hypothetical protein [Verrucomicrobiota bacterium]